MIENTILSGLIFNEVYARKVLPHIVPDYFEDDSTKVLSKLIIDHYRKYNTSPSKEMLKVELETKSLPEKLFENTGDIISKLSYEEADVTWMVDKTEEFCKERALHNALITAVDMFDKKEEVGKIPDILQQALTVSFDSHIGHDYFEDAEARFEFYNTKENKIEFDIDLLNKITDGGVMRKTLNLLIAGTNVGKSMALCHLASAYLAAGMNVLYITLEMSEEMIGQRIDANMLDVDIKDLKHLEAAKFRNKVFQAKSKTTGKLVIKQYPNNTAHTGHFRHLVTELKTKKKFIADVIIVDYLNIGASAKMKMSAGLYQYNKSIAEEFRAFFVEENVIGWSAIQTNREGMASTDMDLTATSDSVGIAFTADMILAMMVTEELDKLRLIKFKQLKNRYGPKDYYQSFVVGIDKSKMRLFDADQSAQKAIGQDEQQISISNKDNTDKKSAIRNMFSDE